jgi:phage shock protein PspC (stress-responsive transcriptional regulator)
MTTDYTGDAASIDAPDRSTAPGQAGLRSLTRPFAGRLIGGVASAVADYMQIDVVIVRIALVVLCLVGGLGIPLYLAGWLLIPDEGSDWSIATELLHGPPSY